MDEQLEKNIKKAGLVDEAMKKTGIDKELTESQQSITKMGTIMGANPVNLITGFMNQNQTEKAETENPMPEIDELDPTKRKIIEMLCEGTGTHICDSGGAYGRNWQRNRSRDFEKEPACTVEIWGDNEVHVTYNIYHYLTNFLEMTDESQLLQTQFEVFSNEPENRDESWLTNMEDFIEKITDVVNYGRAVTNTYNYDNILGQVLQYGIFGYDGDMFIILQIHGGCDVRGGYTNPYIFSLLEHDYFHIAQHDISAHCTKCKQGWYSDDGGYHYYSNNSSDEDFEFETDEDDEKALHKDCGGELNFHVMEDY
jgi:hypothetical protein|tara:strand:+ start:6010 stop:6942 length:933 start_codon:yes stop_codon:yes gene_type:complete